MTIKKSKLPQVIKQTVRYTSPKLQKYIDNFCKLKRITQVIVVIIVITSLWMLSGLFFQHKTPPHSKLTGYITDGYKVETFTMQDYSPLIELQASTEFDQQVMLRAEVDAKVVKIFVKEGQYLKNNDPIIELEMDGKQEDLAKAKAILDQRRIEYSAAKALQEKKLSSGTEMARATAQLRDAESIYKQARLSLEHHIISAPFDGFIDNIEVKVGDFLSNVGGKSNIGEFISDKSARVIAWVVQQQISQIKQGQAIYITRHDGSKIHGNIDFISKISDPSTKTFRIEANLDLDSTEYSEQEPLRSGENITLHIQLQPIKAHYLPSSTLNLNAKGELVVKSLDQDGIVHEIPIKILDEDSNGVWISGLSENVSLITLGHAYLKDGSKLTVKK